MANQTLTPDVRDILERSTITERQLALPEGQLPRSLYEAVNKAITFAGGKWDRSARAHVFLGDPRQKLGLMLETGIAIDEKKQFQAFFTPPEVVGQVMLWADVEGHRVLEPSAGNGALVGACLASGATQVDCVEINPEHRDALIGPRRVVTIADFLTVEPYREFSRIVMNPPFTKNQDIRHVEHALRFLAPGGRLVSIMFGNTDRKQWASLVKDRDYETRRVDRGAFKQSGTNIATIILFIQT